MVYFMVGIGGIIGALLRYYLGVAFDYNQAFPIATLITNMIGCALLGYITSFISRLNMFPNYIVTAMGTGIIGSFTTFSTFSVDTVKLLQESHWLLAILYVLASLWGGLLMAWSGFQLGHYHYRKLEIINRKEGKS